MGSVQQIRVKWNHHQSNFPKVFDNLLHKKEFVDVTLACEGQSLKAHKMVLSACSPYFHTLFVENPCQHPIVIMRDFKYCEIEAVVEYMYKGEVNISRDSLREFLRTAQSLQVKGLADDDNNDGVVTNDTAFTQNHPEPEKVPEILPPRLSKTVVESQSFQQYSQPTPNKRMRIEKPIHPPPPPPSNAIEHVSLPLATTVSSQVIPEIIKSSSASHTTDLSQQTVKLEVKGEVSEFRYDDTLDSTMDESQDLDQAEESPDPDTIILGDEPEIIEEEPEIMFGHNNSQDGRLSQADSLTSTLISALRDGAGPSSASSQQGSGEGYVGFQPVANFYGAEIRDEDKIWSYFEYAPPEVLAVSCFLCGSKVAMTRKPTGARCKNNLIQHVQVQHKAHFFRTMQPEDSIWRYFEFEAPEVCQVTCLLCDTPVARSRYHNRTTYGSSNLYQHLKRRHQNEYLKVQKPGRSPRAKTADKLAGSSVKPKAPEQRQILPKDIFPFVDFLQRYPPDLEQSDEGKGGKDQGTQ